MTNDPWALVPANTAPRSTLPLLTGARAAVRNARTKSIFYAAPKIRHMSLPLATSRNRCAPVIFMPCFISYPCFGILHWTTTGAVPLSTEWDLRGYPVHIHADILLAFHQQESIGWLSCFKGFLSTHWTAKLSRSRRLTDLHSQSLIPQHFHRSPSIPTPTVALVDHAPPPLPAPPPRQRNLLEFFLPKQSLLLPSEK